jgi:hypothetical protein
VIPDPPISDTPATAQESIGLEERVAVAERRRTLRRTAAGFGTAGVIGVAAFVGEMIAGSVSTLDTLGLLAGIVAAFGALAFWHESRNVRPSQQAKEEPGADAAATASALRFFSSVALLASLWPAVRGGSINPVWLAVAVAFLGLSFITIRERHDAESDNRD